MIIIFLLLACVPVVVEMRGRVYLTYMFTIGTLYFLLDFVIDRNILSLGMAAMVALCAAAILPLVWKSE